MEPIGPGEPPRPSGLRRTVASPGVWLGVLASFVIGLHATATRSASDAPWLMLGVGGLIVAWLAVRPGARRLGPDLRLTMALWCLPLLVAAPLLSTDAQAYADLGWMVLHGDNPYVTGLGTTGSPFDVARVWQGTTSVYPALALVLNAAVVAATGASATWAVLGMRVLSVLGVALLAWSLPRIARQLNVDERGALWFGLLNPIVVVHGVGGMHNDLLAVGIAAAGVAMAPSRGRLWTGAAVVGLAAAVKQPALVAIVAVAAWGTVSWRDTGNPRRTLGWPAHLIRLGLATTVAIASFVAVSLLSGLGLGWVDGTGGPAAAPTIAPARVVASLLAASTDQWVMYGQVIALAVVAGAFVLWAKDEPLRFVAVTGLAWALGFGAFWPWYLLLPLAFVGLIRPGMALRALAWFLIGLGGWYSVVREAAGWPLMQAFWMSVGVGLIVLAAAMALEILTPSSTSLTPSATSSLSSRPRPATRHAARLRTLR